MDTVFFIIVGFIFVLAIIDLFVGVSNDAVNFLNSGVGAKVASYKTLIIVASVGVVIGAMMSAGMMDIARNGVLRPENYSFSEVMTVFLAVMVTDVIILDVFNSLGLPTSTTVSRVFELLGAAFVLALLKMGQNPELSLNSLMNSEKALTMIVAIFVSVAIAFVVGLIVQWLVRIVFTFNYKKHLKFAIAPFGGIAFTTLLYFIFIKGLGDSPYISNDVRLWIGDNTGILILGSFVVTTILSEILHLLRVNIFKIVVLGGTMALAMAFAGNDLVNFIGVPLAGLDALQDYLANGAGDPDTFMMTSLMGSAKSPLIYLAAAGIIMVISLATSKKAKNVIKTSVGLSSQDAGDEMFGSSPFARRLVRSTRDSSNFISQFIPAKATKWVDRRFDQDESCMAEGAAFDEVRAAVNLVLASILIVVGTTWKLPLSTTYVTFMVGMGSSLADRAWTRDSAVFRVTGVISVIGGWIMTAAVSFVAAALVCILMHWGGIGVMALFMILVAAMLIHNNNKYKKKQAAEKQGDSFTRMMQVEDKNVVWDLLKQEVSKTQAFVTKFIREQFNVLIEATKRENLRELRSARKHLKEEREMLGTYRRQQLAALKRVPEDKAIENNTWYHLGINSCQQYIYCLIRLLDPIEEHVDNNFQPIPKELLDKFEPVRSQINSLMQDTERIIAANRYELYEQTRENAQLCQGQINGLIEECQLMMHNDKDKINFKSALLYVNLLQESQQLLSIMRHQLRAAKKFLD